VASWVEREGNPRAFFYSLDTERLSNWDHVDAMWAALACGVPTVNGYSSSAPRAWHPFRVEPTFGETEEHHERECLRYWSRTMGIPPEEIAWVQNGRRLPINSASAPDSPASHSSPPCGSL
jgi:hypothetical protein